MNICHHCAYAALLLMTLTLTYSCKGQNVPDHASSLTDVDEPTKLGRKVSDMDSGITTIFQDSQDNYWFGGAKQGVYRYQAGEEQESSLVLFTEEDGLSSHAVLGIQEDKLGNIYFDAAEGISKFDGQKFTTLTVGTSDVSKQEWKLDPDDLWFRMGWDKNGPYRYDGQTLYYLEFPKTSLADEFYAKYPNASYTPYGIYSLYKDHRGWLWFGTSSLGVCRYDGQSISWLYEEQLTKTPDGGDFGIRSILEDSDGYFWFCNSRYRYDILPGASEEEGTSHINYHRVKGVGRPEDPSEESFPYFMSMTEDNHGDLWMATYDNGVWRNDGKKLIHYPIKNDGADVLLFSIYKDKQGVLWLGTHNAGVYTFNGKTFEKFRPL